MIRIYCDAADAVLKETQTLTAGMINYPEVLLTFSDAWDGYGKAVIVKAGEVEESALIVNNKFVVPSECLAESGVNLIVGVSGSDGVHTIPTIWCSCGEIMDGTDVNDSTAVGTATPSLVEQMLGYSQDVVEEAQYLKDYIIKTVEADATGANAYGTANVSVSDSGEGENRTLTFTFTNLKGNGITSLLFTASGENKGRVQVKLDDGTTTNYDGIKEALAAIDSLISDVEDAEEDRAEAETARENAEATRESSEQDRVTAEQSRETAETARQNAEGLRDSNEGVRVQNEAEREENENTRQSNEAARVSAETARAEEFAGWEQSGSVNGLKAEGFATGQQNGVDVGSGSPYYHNNSKYYMNEAGSLSATAVTAAYNAGVSETNAGNSATSAGSSASSASTSALVSEGYALGKQGGNDVGSTSPYYHNNAKYYSDLAAGYADAADEWLEANISQETGYALDSSLTMSNAAAPADKVGELKTVFTQEIDNTNGSLLNLNSIPVNVEYLDITDSFIQQAATVGLTITVTGINKFKINGTATSNFYLWLDFEKTEIGGATTLYYLINRNDGINRQDGVWVQLGWFLANGDPYQPADNISTFNEVVPYTYPATAVTTRNYLRIPSGTSFNNTEFEIIIMRKAPLDADLITKVDTMLIADSYNEVPLTWTLATGYWASNKTFATYGNIYTATVDVVSGENYMLDAKSYYGMCIGVYYSGDIVTADNIIDIIFLSNDDTWHYKYETQVPKDAEHLLLQQYNTNRATLRKISKNTVVKTSLSGKTIAYDGDSIAESRLTGTAANGGGYPYLIAEATGCFFVNKAVSGGILASAVPSGNMPHSVVNSLGQLPDADLYCIEGGVNDFWRDVPLGDYSTTDYSSNVDTTTVCGALEHIIRAITYYHVGKPLIFVLVHKATATISANNAGYTFDQMREKMIGILNKYAIPYYDAYLYSGLNGYNSIQSTTFLTGNSTGQGDGIHPNKAGYIRYYVPQLIQLFERIMPVNEED